MNASHAMTRQERQDRERVRLQAAVMFTEGVSQARIAARLGVSRQAVHQWHQRWRAGGIQALRSAGPPGNTPLLDPVQTARLAAQLRRGAAAHGWPDDRWTLPRINRLISELFGTRFASVGALWNFLHAHGWSWQKPATRARERNEEEITTWREETWPAIKAPQRPRGPGLSSRTSPAPR